MSLSNKERAEARRLTGRLDFWNYPQPEKKAKSRRKEVKEHEQ
jgi:hypothetical protein